MKKRLVIRATRFIGLAGLAGALSAQINLNRIPSRAIGWPLLNISNSSNPNLVEGRELYAPQAVAIDNSVSPPILYVSDFWNNRVLGWKNASGFSNGAALRSRKSTRTKHSTECPESLATAWRRWTAIRSPTSGTCTGKRE
jgi:hypothetical protein